MPRLETLRLCTVVLWCATSTLSAQPRAIPAFDVASVKSNPSRTGIRGHSFPGDRFEAKNVPLRELILVAYGEPGQLLPPVQLSGGPGWIDDDRFDISAIVGQDQSNSVAQKQLMLRSLLADRFKLVVRTETRDLPLFALVLSRQDRALGRQLRHADVDCEAARASEPGRRERCILFAPPSGQLMVRGQTMGALANALTMLLGRVVSDRTGLTGGFDADARFNPDGLPGMAPSSPDDRAKNDAPPLNIALQEQLGLKLESTRGPVDVLVIERVERPTEN